MRRHAGSAALALLLLLVLACFADLLVADKSLYTRDIGRVYYPDFAVLRSLIRSGQVPLWNPFYAGGQPLLANPMYTAFYPLQRLATILPTRLGFNLLIVVHYLIAAAGMFLLLRSLRLGVRASSFGAFSFALGGLMLSLSCLIPFLFSLAWLPWLGFFVTSFLEERRPRHFALAALVLGTILLIGEQSCILQIGALTLAYCAVRLRLRGAVIAAALGAAALVIGIAQLVPALDHRGDSGRAEPIPSEVLTQWSLAPSRPLEMAVPSLFSRIDPETGLSFPGARAWTDLPWVFTWYSGMLAAALIAAGFVHRLRGWLFVAVAALVSYGLAIGKHGPLFPLLIRLGFRSIRYPEKWFLTASFVLIVFAAMAAERLLTDDRFRRTTCFAAILIALANAATRGLLGVALAAALTLILALRHRWAPALLALFVVVDLVPRVPAIAPRIDAHIFEEPPPIARALPPHSRVYSFADAQRSQLASPPLLPAAEWERVYQTMLPDMQAIWGFEGILESDVTMTNLTPSRRFQGLFESARLRGRPDLVPLLLTLSGTTHVIGPKVDALPDSRKFYFATTLVETPRLAEPHPWPRGTAFVDQPFAPAPGRIVRTVERANDLDFDVEASGDAALVLAITPHKYWRATVDGRPVPLVAANVGFQALRVPKGVHHVAMRYRNPLLAACALVALLGALVLAVIAAIGGAPRSTAPPPPSPH